MHCSKRQTPQAYDRQHMSDQGHRYLKLHALWSLQGPGSKRCRRMTACGNWSLHLQGSMRNGSFPSGGWSLWRVALMLVCCIAYGVGGTRMSAAAEVATGSDPQAAPQALCELLLQVMKQGPALGFAGRV